MAKTDVLVDEVVRGAYEPYRDRGLSVDDILVDPDEAIAFAEVVTRELPSEMSVCRRDILRRLIALRKRGQSRGGLPRAERAYHGRRLTPK